MSMREEVEKVVRENPLLFGFQSIGESTVVLISEELSESQREKILTLLPSFKDNVYFLCGLEQADYLEDPKLVQRVLMYSGTLEGWLWSNGSDKWKEFLHEIHKDG